MKRRRSDSVSSIYEVQVASKVNGGQWSIEVEANNHRDAYEKVKHSHNVLIISTKQLPKDRGK